jgi:hypothetical protein
VQADDLTRRPLSRYISYCYRDAWRARRGRLRRCPGSVRVHGRRLTGLAIAPVQTYRSDVGDGLHHAHELRSVPQRVGMTVNVTEESPSPVATNIRAKSAVTATPLG